MLSVFFNKSKPIQYVVLAIALLLIFIITKSGSLDTQFNGVWLIKQFGIFLIVIGSIFVFDFFVTKNKLTKKNSYKMLLFVIFIAILPNTIMNSNIVLANLFLILALRRLLSLRTQRQVKKKLFDSAFWISLATLCYFWCAVYFILIFTTLLVYTFTDIKNYIIPLVGIAAVLIISVSYRIVMGIDIFSGMVNFTRYSLDFSTLNNKRIIIGATVLFSFGLWSLFYFLKNIKSKMKSYRPTFRLIVITIILSLLIIMLAPKKNGSEFMFLFAPLAIIITNYVEMISENWFKESFLWVLVLTPIIISIL